MKLRFEALWIDSFKSFGKGHELLLTETRPGLHFMRGINRVEPRLGSNGAGKSSVWDALCWCLYGKTVAGLKNTDIQPWVGKRGASVRVAVTVDGVPYDIERTAHPNALTINRKTAGPDVPAEKLGLSFDLFCNTILLGQGQPLFFDLAPRAKMDLFTDVLALDRWDMRSKAAGAKVGLLEADLATVGTEQFATKSHLADMEGLLKTAQEQSAEWDEERSRKVEGAREALTEANGYLEGATTKHAKAFMDSEGAALELKHFDDELRKIQKALDKAKEARSTEQAKLATFRGQISELNAQLEAFGEKDVCPICKQSIKGTSLATHKRELRDRVRSLQSDIDAGVPKKLDKAVTDQEKQRKQYENYQDEWRGKAAKAEAELAHWVPRIAELKAQITGLENSLSEHQEQDNPFSDQISTLKKRKIKLTRQLANLEEEEKSLAQRIERTRFWVKGFKEIRLFIVEEVLQQLELTTNAGLAEIGMPDWRVRYAIEKETKSGTIQRGLTVEILSPSNRNPVRWESWSGGEGQRLRLVGALALSEVLLNYAGVQTNLEILDEPTRGLSSEGVRDLCDFLAGRALQLERQTFYVDHMANESAKFRSILTVVKDKSGTHFERST